MFNFIFTYYSQENVCKFDGENMLSVNRVMMWFTTIGDINRNANHYTFTKFT